MPSESSRPFSGSGVNRKFYLPRLAPEHYQGDAVIHWTLSIARRGTGWLTENFHHRFREIMLHAAAREGLLCPAYCLMPDHIHLVWMGLRLQANQRNGMRFLRQHLAPALRPYHFQPQAHDHVLGQEERRRNAFAGVCFYILANPVRAGLRTELERWAFCGAVIPGYPKLHPLEEDFWPLFWRLYSIARAPDAGNIARGFRQEQA